MLREDEKYERILNILRKSGPVLGDTSDIEDNVIERIRHKIPMERTSYSIFDYLFGWVYIGWLRKSLVAASVLLIAAFGYQQAIILKRINILNDRNIFSESQLAKGVSNNIDDKLLLYRFTDSREYDKPIKISNRQLKRLIESINELQLKYDDLIKLIEENPELKKYVNEKMKENNRKKLKL